MFDKVRGNVILVKEQYFALTSSSAGHALACTKQISKQLERDRPVLQPRSAYCTTVGNGVGYARPPSAWRVQDCGNGDPRGA
jgi:Holliday junction resolvasome RuvABC DNA-binding subunit